MKVKVKLLGDVKITLTPEQSRKLAVILRFSGYIPSTCFNEYEFNQHEAEIVSSDLLGLLDEAGVGGK